MKKRYYYEMEMNSRGGTHRSCIRSSDKPLSRSQREDALNSWTDAFSHLDYYATISLLKKVPKNRKEALKLFGKSCSRYHFWKTKKERLANLLCHKPFNGEKL